MTTQPRPPSGGAPARKTVLLVDDSPTVIAVEQALLSRRYRVICAGDGVEGVERAHAEHPDLILMDVLMPRLSGLQALEELRAAPDTCQIPIIMVTTRGELANVEHGYASGCNDYVTKPFSGVELLEKVRNCLGE